MPTINVQTQGALGDGTTDDGVAIRAAIVAAGTGGCVYFPEAEYRYVADGTLGLSDITILGDGSTLSTLLYESEHWESFFQNTGPNVTFRNWGFKRNTATSNNMMLVTSGVNLTFDNCLLDGNNALGPNDGNHCFQFGGRPDTPSGPPLDPPSAETITNFKLLNTTVKNWGGYPLFQQVERTGTSTGIVVENCTFTDNHFTPLELNSPGGTMQDIRIVNNVFEHGDGPPSAGFAVGLAHCDHVVVAYNTFSDFEQEALHIEDRSSDVVVEHNSFELCGLAQYGSILIISSASNVRVRHNFINADHEHPEPYAGAILSTNGGGVSNPSDIVIDNNTIIPGTHPGIVHQSDGIVISNNRFDASVSIDDWGSTGATLSNNTVSTAAPANFGEPGLQPAGFADEFFAQPRRRL